MSNRDNGANALQAELSLQIPGDNPPPRELGQPQEMDMWVPFCLSYSPR